MTTVAMSKACRRVLKLLESRAGEWVSRFELMGLGIVQYRERIRELRKMGCVIENRREYAGKVRDSCYRLAGKAADAAEGDVASCSDKKFETRKSKLGKGESEEAA